MSLGGVPPGSIQGVCTGRHKAKQGDPRTPQNWGCGMGGGRPRGTQLCLRLRPRKGPQKNTKKPPKWLKINPKWRRLGPESVEWGVAGLPPSPSCFLLHPRFVFGVNFWSLAAPNSWPINIYIYICIQKWGRGLAGGHPHPYCHPQRNQTAEIQSALKPSLDVTKPAGARQEHGPGHGPRCWGSRPPSPPPSLPPSLLPPPYAGGGGPVPFPLR